MHSALFLSMLLLPLGAAVPHKLTITSPAFRHEGPIPAKYTCDGPDLIPPIHIAGVPSGARSLALVVDDPDAPRGTWVHWVMWNIPVATTRIIEGVAPRGEAGTNSAGKRSWHGPCPPGGTHRYFFRVFALDTALTLPASTTAAELESAVREHVIARGELMGTYARKR